MAVGADARGPSRVPLTDGKTPAHSACGARIDEDQAPLTCQLVAMNLAVPPRLRSTHTLLRELAPSLPIADRVLALSEQVSAHQVFRSLDSVADVQIFMEHHVWAVWDFMSLLKSIQSVVAPVTVPWRPPRDAAAARFINEIAAGEEGDDGP